MGLSELTDFVFVLRLRCREPEPECHKCVRCLSLSLRVISASDDLSVDIPVQLQGLVPFDSASHLCVLRYFLFVTGGVPYS